MVQVGLFVLFRTVVADIVTPLSHYLVCLRTLAEYRYSSSFGADFSMAQMFNCLPQYLHYPYPYSSLNPLSSDDSRVLPFQAIHWLGVVILYKYGPADDHFAAFLSNVELLASAPEDFVQGLYGDIYYR